MQTARAILPLLALLLAACPAPDQLRGLPELLLLPTGPALYKVPGDNGFESLNVALRVDGPASALDADALVLELYSGEQLHLRQQLDRAALAAHLVRGHSGPRTRQYENLHLLLPESLELDRLVVTLQRGERSVATTRSALRRYVQQHRYRLPLEGCWFVSAAHDFGTEHRRWYGKPHFAWDFVRLDSADGMRDDKTRLEDYAAYGQPVLAPADGMVLQGRDDQPDNPPGVVGRIEAANFVLIHHGEGEQSKLAHLQQGSLVVGAGDRVQAGQVIARVGNSGRSDAPHLHLHFQRTLMDEEARIVDEQPIPVQLGGYRSTSNLGVAVSVDRGSPRRGDFVCAEGRSGGVGVGTPSSAPAN